MRSALPKFAAFGALVLVAALLRVYDANPALAQTQSIGAWQVTEAPPLDGSAPEWQSIVPVFLPTTSQQVAPPMGGGAVERVAVRSVHYQDNLYVMMEWIDRTADEFSDHMESFTDAAAIQFPAVAGSEVPAICMGQADQAVSIWQWRADQQNPPPGLPENAYVDSYPSTDDLFYTARAAGNPLSADEDRIGVHSLVAGGFGTLEVADQGGLDGRAVYRDGRWMVVFSRPLVASGDLQPDFDSGGPTDVAFAVWNGSEAERNGVKSVTAFTRLQITSEDAPRRAVGATDDWPAFTPFNAMVPISIAFTILLGMIAVGLWWLLRPSTTGSDSDEST